MLTISSTQAMDLNQTSDQHNIKASYNVSMCYKKALVQIKIKNHQ